MPPYLRLVVPSACCGSSRGSPLLFLRDADAAIFLKASKRGHFVDAVGGVQPNGRVPPLSFTYWPASVVEGVGEQVLDDLLQALVVGVHRARRSRRARLEVELLVGGDLAEGPVHLIAARLAKLISLMPSVTIAALDLGQIQHVLIRPTDRSPAAWMLESEHRSPVATAMLTSGDITHLGGQVAGHRVDVVRQILPRAGHRLGGRPGRPASLRYPPLGPPESPQRRKILTGPPWCSTVFFSSRISPLHVHRDFLGQVAAWRRRWSPRRCCAPEPVRLLTPCEFTLSVSSFQVPATPST